MMPGKPLDPQAVTNTVALALELGHVLTDLGVTTEQLDTLTDEAWLMAAKIVYKRRSEQAGHPPTRKRTHPPGEATRAAVATIFRDRDKNPDPFASFPKAGT
jgi:hypothetical protein